MIGVVTQLVALAAFAAVVCPRSFASTVGYWRFESGAGFTQDSGGNAGGPFPLTNEGGNNTNDALVLPTTGPGSAFPRTVLATGATNLGAAVFSPLETPPDNFTTPHRSVMDSQEFTIEAFVNLASGPGAEQSRTIASFSSPTFSDRTLRFFVAGTAAASPTRPDRLLGISVGGITNSGLGVIFSAYFNQQLVVGQDYYVAVTFRFAAVGAQVTGYIKNLTTNSGLQTQVINATTTSLVQMGVSTQPFRIGGGTTFAGELPWDGLIDELRFSNTVLPESELLISTAPPKITAQPISVTVLNGQKVALVAGASGSGLSYQWRSVGKGVIAGATNPLFVLPSVSAADTDIYFCRVTNSGGTVDSSLATVTVVSSATTPGYLRALSLRGNVGSDADAFFVGFVVDGTSPSSVLVKANGPGLATLFNVPGAMVDPRLDLINASTSAVVAANDNWGGGQTLITANNAAGAFPLPDPASKDAVILTDLSAGTYTAKVTGVGNTTGVALAEIYGLSTPANLRALSLRGRAGAGADVFFLGFVVAGDTAKTVLIKAVGPGLATLFNVPGAMVDPTLELTNASTSAVLGGNDNWGGLTDLATANTAVGAFPLPDASSKDGAMLITLPPGVYIARVGGTNSTEGVVLVEIYGL